MPDTMYIIITCAILFLSNVRFKHRVSKARVNSVTNLRQLTL